MQSGGKRKRAEGSGGWASGQSQQPQRVGSKGRSGTAGRGKFWANEARRYQPLEVVSIGPRNRGDIAAPNIEGESISQPEVKDQEPKFLCRPPLEGQNINDLLSTEALAHIFSFISTADLIQIGQVCRTWREHEQLLWRYRVAERKSLEDEMQRVVTTFRECETDLRINWWKRLYLFPWATMPTIRTSSRRHLPSLVKRLQTHCEPIFLTYLLGPLLEECNDTCEPELYTGIHYYSPSYPYTPSYSRHTFGPLGTLGSVHITAKFTEMIKCHETSKDSDTDRDVWTLVKKPAKDGFRTVIELVPKSHSELCSKLIAQFMAIEQLRDFDGTETGVSSLFVEYLCSALARRMEEGLMQHASINFMLDVISKYLGYWTHDVPFVQIIANRLYNVLSPLHTLVMADTSAVSNVSVLKLWFSLASLSGHDSDDRRLEVLNTLLMTFTEKLHSSRMFSWYAQMKISCFMALASNSPRLQTEILTRDDSWEIIYKTIVTTNEAGGAQSVGLSDPGTTRQLYRLLNLILDSCEINQEVSQALQFRSESLLRGLLGSAKQTIPQGSCIYRDDYGEVEEEEGDDLDFSTLYTQILVKLCKRMTITTGPQRAPNPWVIMRSYFDEHSKVMVLGPMLWLSEALLTACGDNNAHIDQAVSRLVGAIERLDLGSAAVHYVRQPRVVMLQALVALVPYMNRIAPDVLFNSLDVFDPLPAAPPLMEFQVRNAHRFMRRVLENDEALEFLMQVQRGLIVDVLRVLVGALLEQLPQEDASDLGAIGISPGKMVADMEQTMEALKVRVSKWKSRTEESYESAEFALDDKLVRLLESIQEPINESVSLMQWHKTNSTVCQRLLKISGLVQEILSRDRATGQSSSAEDVRKPKRNNEQRQIWEPEQVSVTALDLLCAAATAE